MQVVQELWQSFARHLSRARCESSEMTTSTRSVARYLRSSKKIFSTGLIARCIPPRPRRQLHPCNQIASGQGRLRLNCGDSGAAGPSVAIIDLPRSDPMAKEKRPNGGHHTRSVRWPKSRRGLNTAPNGHFRRVGAGGRFILGHVPSAACMRARLQGAFAG